MNFISQRDAILEYLKVKVSLSYDENSFALIFLDSDKFKQVNDGFGHKIGDFVLRESINRVKKVLRKNDIIGRYGGDEFLILLENVTKNEILKIDNKIIEAIKKEYKKDEKSINFLSTSIGVAFCKKDASNPIDLIEKADRAMYYAKKNLQEPKVAFYDEIKNKKNEKTIKSEFLTALKTKDIFLKFQPVVNIKTKQIQQVESLARWLNIVYDDVPTEVFLNIVNLLGIEIEFDKYVLNKLLDTFKEYNFRYSKVSINISKHFFLNNGFEKYIVSLINKNPFLKDKLIMEITQEVFVDDFKTYASKIDRLCKYGVAFAIDNFGAGFSSLSYLKNLHIDIIKIDKKIP